MFPALDFTAVLSALSKFSSLEERITDGSSSRAGATPGVTVGTERVCGGSRAAQAGVAPALELFCRVFLEASLFSKPVVSLRAKPATRPFRPGSLCGSCRLRR